MPNTNTRTTHDLSGDLAAVVREVLATGEDAIIAEGGTEVAVIMPIADYERLHHFADLADATRPGYAGAGAVKAMSISEMLDVLGVDPPAVRRIRR